MNYAQRPTFLALFGTEVVVRADDVRAAPSELRDIVARVDPDIPVRVSTLNGLIARSAADRRFNAFVLAAFALAALLLAGVGVYGVVAYTVTRRTREMGIRVALGARPSQVRGSMQRDVLATAGVGAAAGVVVSLLLSRGLESLLFDVSPTDPVTFAACIGVLGAAAWTASWIPAWRGTRAPPGAVLRDD